MEPSYLEFERPIAELEERIKQISSYAQTEGVDLSDEINTLQERAARLRLEIYSHLTRWQRVEIARHPQRPYTLDYIRLMMTGFKELHGDRTFGDDDAIVGGLAKLDGLPLMVIGHQKGRTTKDNIRRNWGMAHPEGYRKALRLMKLAARFHRPVLSLVDTPAAYPGIGAEERGIAEAIARNLLEMSRLPTPIVVVIIGEGGSGGALGIGIGDLVLMMENAWYAVIPPESCSTILFRSRDKKKEAAEALKLSAADLIKLGVIDEIVPEPLGGAHHDPDQAASELKARLAKTLPILQSIPVKRMDNFCMMGICV